ncbi:MAG: hypothetical protein JWN76_3342 [Chitinophagaceae bacterium]|nr:hypothetical protein [Chitinophagaceae bacterium]
MEFFAPINIKKLQPAISYNDKILMMGSCFTEHIGNYLQSVKFSILQNPNGILFDPLSVSYALISYIKNKKYSAEELVLLDDMWHSWKHHSRFSSSNMEDALSQMNDAQQEAHLFLKEASWLVITLGSSFVYKLAENNKPVANCHKAPAAMFKKELYSIDTIISSLENAIRQLFDFNPSIHIIFTISPVRHLRDGVVENNRSKARLIEAVHHLISGSEKMHYFPAYELVIDVLRDYRFYDIDLAHPNYAATSFVLEKFSEFCLTPQSRVLAEDIRKLTISKNHRPFNPSGKPHKAFLKSQWEKAAELQKQYPYLDFSAELSYFSS